MAMKKIMIFAAATLLMGSCGVYNKYERPDVNATGLVRDAYNDADTLVVQDTASFGNLPGVKCSQTHSCSRSSSRDSRRMPTC